MATPLSQAKIIADLAVRTAAMEAQQATMEAQQATMARAATATADLVKEIHDALMKRSPGQDGSFLDRATDLLINVESGSRLFNLVIAAGKVVLAISAIVAAWVAFVKFGVGGGKP